VTNSHQRLEILGLAGNSQELSFALHSHSEIGPLYLDEGVPINPAKEIFDDDTNQFSLEDNRQDCRYVGHIADGPA